MGELVSLHETSMIVHFNYLVDMSLYQHYFMCLYISVCDWLRVTAFRTGSDDPNSVTRDPDSCPLWTRYTGDSKTDPWDDP